MNTKIGNTKGRYRLLADGEIIDQETSKTCGFIWGVELEEVWGMRPLERQSWLKSRVKENRE